MARSVATVPTTNAGRYLQQLCKHWGHRFEVVFDPQAGRIDFGDGQSVELAADARVLRVIVIDRDAARLDELEAVVAEHLQRFAFREALAFDWSRGESAEQGAAGS